MVGILGDPIFWFLMSCVSLQLTSISNSSPADWAAQNSQQWWRRAWNVIEDRSISAPCPCQESDAQRASVNTCLSAREQGTFWGGPWGRTALETRDTLLAGNQEGYVLPWGCYTRLSVVIPPFIQLSVRSLFGLTPRHHQHKCNKIRKSVGSPHPSTKSIFMRVLSGGLFWSSCLIAFIICGQETILEGFLAIVIISDLAGGICKNLPSHSWKLSEAPGGDLCLACEKLILLSTWPFSALHWHQQLTG